VTSSSRRILGSCQVASLSGQYSVALRGQVDQKDTKAGLVRLVSSQ